MVHRCRGLTFVMVLAVLIGGFFSGGCLGSAGGALVKGGLDEAKEWFKTELENSMPTIEGKLIALAEAQLAKQEAKVNADFDSKLLKVAPFDPTTGAKAAKTWKDFDADKDGHLSPIEVGYLTKYIFTEGPKRVADGSMTSDDWSNTQKGTAGTAAGATALGIAYIALKKRKDSKKAKEAAAAGGSPPKAPEPSPAAA